MNLVEANALNTNRVVLGTDFSAHSIFLSAPSITVNGDIGNAAYGGLFLTATSGDIGGGSGTAIAQTVWLNASGAIGVGAAVKTNTTRNLLLTTHGVGAAGNISVREANALTMGASRVLQLSTNPSAQTVSLGAPSITMSANIGDAADDLVFAGPSMISGGAPSGTGRLTNLAGSSLIFAPASPLTLSRPIVNAGSASISAGSTLVIGSGGSFQNAATGTLSGTGTIDMRNSGGALRNDGTIAPGGVGSAGTLAIQGDVIFGATGSLNIERFSSTSNDQLAVSGKATLAGAFGFTDLTSPLLFDGSTNTVLTYGTTSGTFTTISLPARYSATYLTDRFYITTPNFVASTGGSVAAAFNTVVGSAPSAGQLLNLFGAGGTTTFGAATGSTADRIVDCSTGKSQTTAGC